MRPLREGGRRRSRDPIFNSTANQLVATRDERLMAEAVKLGRLRKGRTAPNPAVGAVVAAGDRVLGKGFHERAGAPHAEVVALKEAGRRRGARRST